MGKLAIRLGLLIGLALASLNAGAAVTVTCTSVATKQTDWDKSNAWNAACNGQPPAGATVIIANGTSIKVDANTANVGSVMVNAGGTLTIAQNFVLSLSGDFTNNGTFTAQTGSTVSFTGANPTISGNVTFANLQLGANTVLTLKGNITVTGTVTGTVNLASTCPSNFTITDAAGAVLGQSCPLPIAEYRFDEGSAGAVADTSGNGLNGALNGGVNVGGGGKVCGSYNFNGTDAFVSVPNNALLNQTQVTVAAWVRHSNSTIKQWEAILAKGDTAYRLHLNGGCSINTPNKPDGLSFGINSGCGTADADSSVVPVANQWYHVVGTYDGTTIKIYVDGALKVSAASKGSIGGNTFPLYIGANSQQAGRFWSGDIDEVKIYSSALTAAQVTTGYTNEKAGKNWDGTTRTCPAVAVDHILIQHPGVGLTCSPQTVLVRACANAACTSLVGGIGVTLQPGGATVTTSSIGDVNATVAQTTAGAVTLSATSSAATVNAAQCINTTSGVSSCAMTFNTAGYVISAPNHTSCTAAAVTIEAMQASTTNRCVPAYSNVTQPVDLSLAYTNPATGTKSATVATGTIGTTASTHNLAFDANGKATLSLTYPDVGLVTLNATGAAPNGVTLSGSGSFVAAPASLTLSATTPTAPIKAGNAFDVTVLGYTAVSSACPTALETPNYGHEAIPQLALVKTRTGPASGGSDPALSSSTITALTSGVTASQNWPEVGDITLQARLLPDAVTPTVSNYLGYVQGAEINSAVSGNIRFIPDHFNTSIIAASVMPCPIGQTCPCPPQATCPPSLTRFVYDGQPFSATVFASNAADQITKNYDGALGYAKSVTLSAVDAPGGAASSVGSITLATRAVAASSFTNGIAGVATPLAPVYSFTSTPTLPTDIYLRAAESSGGDGVSSLRNIASASWEQGIKVVSGRVKVSSAYGSELLPQRLQATAQYYTNNGWTNSVTDSATNMTLSSPYTVGSGSSVVTFVAPADASCLPYTDGNVCKGVATINLAKPSATGAATIAPGAPAYLPVIPGTATFGVYKGNNRYIYRRER